MSVCQVAYFLKLLAEYEKGRGSQCEDTPALFLPSGLCELPRTLSRNCLKSPSENSGAWILVVHRAKNVSFLPHFCQAEGL